MDAPDPGEDPRFLSSHHAGILEVYAMARRLGFALPADVRFYAVGVLDATAFREGLSPSLAERVPGIARTIALDLGVGPAGGGAS